MFVALPLPAEAREKLAGVVAEFTTEPAPIRWVRTDGLHLTLKFLGEVPEQVTPGLIQALTPTATGTAALSVSTTEVGGFPTLSHARVVWVGLKAPPALELLAHRVERACAGLGFPLEERVFQPHVTLGRVEKGARLEHGMVKRLGEVRPELDFTLESLVLYSSHPGAGGSCYEPVASFPLAA
jgi:2'-5' RNA ligase